MRNQFKRVLALLLFPLVSGLVINAYAKQEHYAFDMQGAHAFIQFKISHLGFSWLWGRFNRFDGHFILDRENIENSSVETEIDVTSIDSNHGRRDKHLSEEEFLYVKKFPKAMFKSTKVKKTGEKTGVITGLFTLRGVTKEIDLDVTYTGGGKDPWGGYRQGFEATTQLTLADFGIPRDLGPASQVVDIIISIEGIRK